MSTLVHPLLMFVQPETYNIRLVITLVQLYLQHQAITYNIRPVITLCTALLTASTLYFTLVHFFPHPCILLFHHPCFLSFPSPCISFLSSFLFPVPHPCVLFFPHLYVLRHSVNPLYIYYSTYALSAGNK